MAICKHRRFAFLTVLMFSSPGAAAPVRLVTERTVQVQKDLTSLHKLRNGIPVVVRHIPDSDIVEVDLTFGSGLKDLRPGQKALNQWLWTLIPLAAAGYPKAKVFQLSETYGIQIACGGGIEYSSCTLGTLDDYWAKALPLFAAIVTKPSLTNEDVNLTKQRLTATLIDTPSDPGTYVNEIINSIFYPIGHPYRLNHDEALKELQSLERKDLAAYHQQITNAQNLRIVVVSSMPAAKVLADLNKAFGDIKPGESPKVVPPEPLFDAKRAFRLEDRTLPTAYMRIKLNAPSIRDKDAVAMQLLYEILGEELSDEIRTKRSLSYAVHALTLQYSLGIGMLNVSTSKPEETLSAITEVLNKFRSRLYTEEEVEEYKHGFATSYYLTQETHASLGAALAKALFYYGDVNQYYEMPRLLEKVTPAELQRLANRWLNDLRIGVIYGRKDFQDEWATSFIQQHSSVALQAAPAPSSATE